VSHLVILPLLLPLVAGSVLLLASRLADGLRRFIGLVATLALLPIALLMMERVGDGSHIVYALGAWSPPFGIVLVADRLAALMLLLTSVVAIASLVYATCGEDTAGAHFHALFQFQLLGINGAFLTGDLFNMFVFFEVMLIAFYTLLLHGLGPQRVGAALQVVVLNLIGSALFLFAVGTLYGVTGTLNLADLARVIPQLGPDTAPIARSGALLLLGVFALKAALLPLGFWLPRAYGAATAAVAALFAVLTKVGVYAILRVYTLAFGPEAGLLADVAEPWVLPLALATLTFGALGAIGARALRPAAGWLVLYSVGTLLVAVGLFSEAGYAAAVYYTAHSTLVSAALFLIVDLVARRRVNGGDRLEVVDSMPHAGLLGSLFFVAAVAMAGLPPLTGFTGKIMILDAAAASGRVALTWSILLVTALVVIVALARSGSAIFWRTAAEGGGPAAAITAPRLPRRAVGAAVALLACLAAMIVWGGSATAYAWSTARQLAEPAGYIEAVLGAAPDDRRSLR
jgi:multicomponent K+:H+ antiporter subunit D